MRSRIAHGQCLGWRCPLLFAFFVSSCSSCSRSPRWIPITPYATLCPAFIPYATCFMPVTMLFKFSKCPCDITQLRSITNPRERLSLHLR
ncbi:uncharacterized protein BJX67DRAFT_225557 [Aspergillus lucknowensis]|uniref:Secreted protein n=1 Tax=Aspergillus lucknowensis TaxID=176173 RepID=A0ABR4LLJ2_9EURO